MGWKEGKYGWGNK